MATALATCDERGVIGCSKCGAPFAQIYPAQHPPHEIFVDAPGGRFSVVAGGGYLAFRPGWYPHGDLWRLSVKAKRRIAMGLPALRRYPQNLGFKDDNDVMPNVLEPLPVRAACPECNRENLITKDVAAVVAVLLIPARH